MTAIDWLIVAFTALLAVYGYIQGFIVGALSLIGFLVGAFIGTRLAPLVLSQGARSPYAPLLGLLGALLAGGVLASGFEGVGARARAMLRLPGLRTIDGLLGALLTACIGLGVAWIVGAVALQSTGSQPLRTDIQRSAILTELDQLLPRSSTRWPGSIRCRRSAARSPTSRRRRAGSWRASRFAALTAASCGCSAPPAG